MNKPAEEASQSHTESSAAPSADNAKLIAAIGYVPFLCVLPLMQRSTSEFLAFHGRQGLLLTIMAVVIGILSPFIAMAVPLVGMLVIWALDLALLVLMVMGGYKAYQGEKWVLPGIGSLADKLKF